MPGEDAWAVGLDLGGTKLAGGLVRFPAGEVVGRRVIPTHPGRGPDAVLADAVGLAGELFGGVPPGAAFAGVGIGLPELVDLDGRPTSGHTIDWRGVRLADRFPGLGPVRVEADVRAAAAAEAHFGAGRPYRSFAYVTVGTGISSTLVLDGRPYPGARGNALVLASGPVGVPCQHCGGWAEAVPEEVAAGSALLRRYNAAAQPPVARCEDVLAAAGRGDPWAARVVREAGAALGGSVGFLVNVLDPEAVVVGGGLGTAGGPYWDAFLESVRRHIWADATRDLPVVRAGLGADAGLVGAAVAAWRDGCYH